MEATKPVTTTMADAHVRAAEGSISDLLPKLWAATEAGDDARIASALRRMGVAQVALAMRLRERNATGDRDRATGLLTEGRECIAEARELLA